MVTVIADFKLQIELQCFVSDSYKDWKRTRVWVPIWYCLGSKNAVFDYLNIVYFLVCIFLYSDWKQSFWSTFYNSIFDQINIKYKVKKLSVKILPFNGILDSRIYRFVSSWTL